MANKRFRSGKFYYRIKHRLLERPLYLSFDSEAHGDDYVARLELLLANGVVPKSVAQRTTRADYSNLRGVMNAYRAAVVLPESDALLIGTLLDKIGHVRMPIDFAWVDGWVGELKDVQRLAPSTIRHMVGALGRCIDWLVRTRPTELASNPIRLLPKRYSTYRDRLVVDEERDRRISAEELAAIRKVLSGWKPPGRERGVTPDPLLALVFELALETAMRLREIYTLTPDQISLEKRTIFLDKTKNGDSRQVPLSTVAVKLLEGFAGFPWAVSHSPQELRRVTSLLSRRFGTVFELAGCPDLHFHDTRHHATCALYERTRLTDIQIARITGHKDLRVLRRYASLRASDLAGQLW
jgi:integrase